MNTIIAGLIAVIIVFGYKIYALKREVTALANELADEHQECSTVSEYNQKQIEMKTAKKAKIMELLAGQAKISNSAVAKELGVSNVSAFRYLEELEKEGKIKQNGGFGKWVYYSKAN